MPFGVWGKDLVNSSQGGFTGSPVDSSNPYSAPGQFSLGGGNPAFGGVGDQSVQTRRFAQVGKVSVNLLDPQNMTGLPTDNIVPIDKPQGPIEAIGNYYNPLTPGGLFSGVFGAIGQTLGGIFGEGGAKVGSQVGQVLGKTVEAPMGIVGGIGVPFLAPVIDQANSAIEQVSPYILRDTLKIPTNIGGAFQSMLNIFGLAGRAVERTYAGSGMRGALPEDIQARVDSGELTHDQALDEMVMSGRGFVNDPMQNMVFSILTDPANWVSLGVGAVGGAVRGVAKIGMEFGGAVRAAEEGSALAKLAESGAGELGRLASEAKAGGNIIPQIAGRDTLAQMRAAIDDNGSRLHLSMVERMGMSALGPVNEDTANLVMKVGHYILKATDPVNFFSGSKAGERSMTALRTSAATGVIAALKAPVVHGLLDIADDLASDGSDRILKAIGAWGGNAAQEVGAHEMASSAMQSGQIPRFGSLNVTEANRELLAGGAWDSNLGKYVEIHVEKTKDITIGTLPYEQMYQQTIEKLAAILDTTPDKVAARVKSISADQAIAVHGLYYYTKGVALHGDVIKALQAARQAGRLNPGIRPEEVTMISPRTLTKQKLPALVSALKGGNLDLIRSEIEKYDDFNWANRTSLPDSELRSQVENWVDANGGHLYDEIPLKDANGNFLPDIPQELQDWASDSERNGYTLGHGIPEDAPLEAHWRVTRDAKGTMTNVNPRLDFWGDTGENVKRLSRWNAMRMAATRSIRQERIIWQQRRRFITDMSRASESHGVDIPPHLSERLWQSLMFEAKRGYLQPRGMAPQQMMDAVHSVLDEAKANNSAQWDNLATDITERQVVLGFLRAMQGDVSLVGVTQKITGGIKAYAPGAAGNYWGQISEKLYPLMRFTLNPVFQAMEFTEPYVLNAMRGVGLPLRRDSEGFRAGLATRNAVEQLIRHSGTPEGLIAETAEALAIGAYSKAEATAKFGKRTWWGKIGMPGGNALLKNAAAGLEARRLIGDNLYEAFKQMKGDQFEAFWGDLQYHFGTSSKAEIADRWLAENLSLQDADGFQVALTTDLMNHKNIGQHLRLAKDARPGVYTFADVETLLDHVRTYQGVGLRKTRGLKGGEALLEDLKTMTNDEWHAEVEKAWGTPRVGRISKSQADDIYRLANGPTPKAFWKGYRGLLVNVTGPTRAATRAVRDKEVRMARSWVKMWAAAKDMTEEEYIALHADDVPKYAPTPPAAATLSPETFTDIRGDWVHRAELANGQMVEPASNIRMTYEDGMVHPFDPYIKQANWAVDSTNPEEFLYGNPSAVSYDLAMDPRGSGRLLGYGSVLWRVPNHAIEHSFEDGPLIRVKRNTLDLHDAGQQTFQLNDNLFAHQGHHIEVLTRNGWLPFEDVRHAGDIVAQQGPPVDPLVQAIYEALPVEPGGEAGSAIYKADLEAIMPDPERMATGNYTGNAYEELNRWLRGHGANYMSEADLRSFANRMDLSMQRGQLRQRTTLWRGINLADWKTSQHGKPDIDYMALTTKPGNNIIYDPAFLSTATERHSAEDFAGGDVRRGILINYDMPAGSKANYMAMHQSENEIILGRRRSFEVYRVVPADLSESHYHEIYVRPVSEEVAPGVLHMGVGDLAVEQRNANRLISDAVHNPKELIRLARQPGDPALAKQAVDRARAAITRAEGAGPTPEPGGHLYGGRAFGPTTPREVATSLEDTFEPEVARTFATLFADFRGRLQHLLETSHPDDSWTGQHIEPAITESNDLRVISTLGTVLPQVGLRAGLNRLFTVMNDVWNHGAKRAEAGVAESASVADRLDHQMTTQLMRGGKTPVPMPHFQTASLDATDALFGNTSRGATGRVDAVMPIIADDAAYEGAGYLTRETFQQILDEHGVPDPNGSGYTRLINEATGEVRLVDPQTLEYVKPGGERIGGAEAIPFPEPDMEVTSAPIMRGPVDYVRSLGGTTGATLVEDARGRRYVEKLGNSTGHVMAEHAANDVYEAMGVPVPHQEMVDVNGVPTQRANYIEGGESLDNYLRTATPEEEAAMIHQIQQPFALDALLGNWDVLGQDGDNIIVKDGVAYRIDNGGSLNYRAQGALKDTTQWRPLVGELDTMRKFGNRWQRHVFGSLPDADLRRQILDLADRRTEILAALPVDQRQMVGQRLNSMLDQTKDIVPAPETTVHVAAESRIPAFQTPSEYDHEYLVKFYNDLAGEMNTRGIGGIKTWTAADAAAMTGRMRETMGRPEGTVLSPDEISRSTVDITPGLYPAPGSTNANLAPILELLNQPRNRTQRHMFMTGVNSDTSRAIRDEFGLIIDNSEDAGIGVFDGKPQPMLSTSVVDNPEKARQIADVMSYATQTPDMVTFIPDRMAEQIDAEGGDFSKYTARATITIPATVGPRAVQKLSLALGEQLPFATRGMISRQLPNGETLIQIIDHDGAFPRIGGNEVDNAAMAGQLEETLKGIANAPNENLDLTVDYGSHHISGPGQKPDGTYDWEGYGDAVHRDLQAGGSTAGRDSLDNIRNAYEASVSTHTRDVSPQNYDRVQLGQPPSHELEDKRGGQVLGTTTPGGLTSSVIRGFGAADPLTGLHELVHMFSIAGQDGSLRDAVSRSWHDRVTQIEKHADNLEAQAQAVTNPAVATRLRNDANAARAGIGTTDPKVWGKAQEEHLVEVLFDWIDKGVPINPDMKNVVEHFRNWTQATRKATRQRGMPPITVSPAMEGIFNRMAMGKGIETVPYSIEDQAMRMAGQQVVRSSWDEAHATQFYKHDRSMMERSINHPYIGLYPASYMWGKVLPEMVRFLALRPFGMETPFLAWNVLREVSDSIRAQSEVDPSWKKFLKDNADAFLLASMFFPSLPQDTPANASLPVRRIAEQGLENQLKYAQGVDPTKVKDIDYAKGASDAMFYALGPAGSIRTASQTLAMAGNLGRSAGGLVSGALAQEPQIPQAQDQPSQDILPLR